MKIARFGCGFFFLVGLVWFWVVVLLGFFFVNINVMRILFLMPLHGREGSKLQCLGGVAAPVCGSHIARVWLWFVVFFPTCLQEGA